MQNLIKLRNHVEKPICVLGSKESKEMLLKASVDIEGLKRKEERLTRSRIQKEEREFWNSRFGNFLWDLDCILKVAENSGHASEREIDFLIIGGPLMIDADDKQQLKLIKEYTEEFGPWETLFNYWRMKC